MCGITGGVFAKPVEDRGLLDRMRDTMRHRGPDDSGTWWSRDGRIGLAHRRLSIIDLTPGGHQPMVDEGAGLVVVYNGEIYNFIDLRNELESKGAGFRSSSDTEVLMEAYREWGEECLDRLDGMYAFAIYDRDRGRLFLARDRAGEKPLYYCHRDGELRFASELKALMADPEFCRRIDRRALNSYLAFGYIPGDQCILAGVRKLPPACALSYDIQADQLHMREYWTVPRELSPETNDPDELTGSLGDLLAGSVRRRLVADVPVGILLSGGIDSSLVTAMATEVSSAPVRTFTISFPGHEQYDEGPYARRIAEHFGTEHTELAAEPATVDLLPLLARQYDEPMADSSMIPTYLVSRQIKQHATVALGGDGGDELFGGYPAHSWIQDMQKFRSFVPGGFRRLLRTLAGRMITPGRLGRNYILGGLSDLPESIIQVNMYFDGPARRRILADELGDLSDNEPSLPESYKRAILREYDTPLRKITAMDFRTYLADDILVKVDRASMLTSLEVRAPFLARDIIEFAFSRVPDEMRATSRKKKILSRRLAERLLPGDMDLTRKQGFMLPLQAWFKGNWGSYVREVLMDSAGEIFRRGATEQLLREQAAGRRHTQRLYAMTLFELWRREYNITLT